MATEEVNKPSSLPPYSEMILAAISALDEKTGSSKSAISKYMESSYGDLPTSHASLLTAHLNRMKDSGELAMVKNNYMRPNPNSPPKRGRGRPPKPKLPLPAGGAAAAALSPPRPRGRPPKPKDPLAAAAAKAASGLPKRRGRPPKKVARPATVSPAAVSSGVKRGRGRPPKVKPQFAEVGFD